VTAVVRAVAEGTVEEIRQTATSLESVVRPILAKKVSCVKVLLSVRSHVLAVVQYVEIRPMRMEVRVQRTEQLAYQTLCRV